MELPINIKETTEFDKIIYTGTLELKIDTYITEGEFYNQTYNVRDEVIHNMKQAFHNYLYSRIKEKLHNTIKNSLIKCRGNMDIDDISFIITDSIKNMIDNEVNYIVN